MLRFCFVLLFTASSSGLLAQKKDSLFIQRIADEILVNGKAYAQLKVLCKTVGGRLAGSAQMLQAESWGVKALQQSGADKVWLQACQVPHWVRGPKEEAYYLDQGRKVKLDVLALGNSVGTGPQGIKAPVLLIRNFEELEEKKDQVKGKIVFYNYPFNPRYIKTFQSYGDAVRYRGQGPSRAARYGAVAVIVRSMTHAANNFPHTGATSYDSAYPKIPAIAVGIEDADRLAAVLTQQKMITVFLRSQAAQLPDVTGHNVIGELVGTDFPEQIITVGGHLDSWDLATGAIDNGIGSFAVLDIARAFMANNIKPKRTIQFVMFMGEEEGLLGSRAYVEDAVKNKTIDQIRYMMNYDMSNDIKGYSTSAEDSRELFTSIGAIAHSIDTSFSNLFRVGAGLHSDHQPFMLQGVPTGGGAGGGLPKNAGPCYHADCEIGRAHV